jgi:hypothetical protein
VDTTWTRTHFLAGEILDPVAIGERASPPESAAPSIYLLQSKSVVFARLVVFQISRD